MSLISKLITLAFMISLASCGKHEIGTHLAESGKKLGETSLGTVESFGQIPRDIGNQLLGTDKDSNEAIEQLQYDIDLINARIDKHQDALDSLEVMIDDTESDQDTISALIGINVGAIAALESNTTVKEMVDPCGDDVGHFDEVLLVMSNGDIVAYFQQGNKRFLSILPNGNYRTTDAQRCGFTVNNGSITW